MNKLECFKAKLRGLIKSWTAWINSAFATVVLALPMLESTFPQLQEFLPDNVYKTMALVIIVSNIAVRFRTNKGLESK